MENLEQAIEDGDVVSARIYQNREVPTGSVSVELEDGSKEINNDNVKKSPQTGDYIIIAVGTLIIMLSIIVLTRTTVKNKKMHNKNNS